MEWLYFLAGVENDLSSYFIVLGITLFIYIGAYHRYIKNVFDPLFMIVAQFIFAASVVIFMYMNNMLAEDDLFYTFVSTETAFFAGLVLSSRKKSLVPYIVSIANTIPIFNISKVIVYYFYAALFVVERIITYASFGLPIFSQGTHAAFYQGYGKVLQGIELATLPILLFLLLERYLSPNISRGIFGKISDTGLVFFILFALLTTGAKSSLFIVMFSLFFYTLYVKKTYSTEDANTVFCRIKIWYIGIFALVVGGAIFTLFLEENSDTETVLLTLVIRLVASGDVFAYFFQAHPGQYVGFGGGVIGLFLSLFGSVFDKLGLLSGANNSVIEDLYWQFLHIFPGSGQGPNTRFDLFGLIFFGYIGASIYAFFLGFLSGITRAVMIERRNVNVFLFVLSALVYYYSLMFTIDLVLFFNYLWKVILFNFVFFFILWWLFGKNRKHLLEGKI
jgi:hypothetical protein